MANTQKQQGGLLKKTINVDTGAEQWSGDSGAITDYLLKQYGQQDQANTRMNALLREEQNQPFLGNAPAQGTNPIPSYVGGRDFGGGVGAAVPPHLQGQLGKFYATNRFTPENKGLLSQMGVSPEMITQAQAGQTAQAQPKDVSKEAYEDGQAMVAAGRMTQEAFNKAYDARFGSHVREAMLGVQKKYEPKTQAELLEVKKKEEEQKADIWDKKQEKKQEIKLKAAKPKEKATLNAINLTTDTLLKSVNELKTMKGADSIFGLWGAYTPEVREKARDARAKLNSIVSQLGVRALNDMRAASQTGGAVGQVTEKEWPILQSQIASLEQAQSWEAAKLAMDDIIATVTRVKKYSQERYNDIYSEEETTPPPDDTTPVVGKQGNIPAVGAVSKGYRFKGGDPSQESNWEMVQ